MVGKDRAMNLETQGRFPTIEKVKIPVFEETDLKRFFMQYVASVFGGANHDADYVADLLGRLVADDVMILKREAYHLDIHTIATQMQRADMLFPELGKGAYFQRIGDSVLGVFGFFPEIERHRREYRDRDYFEGIGRKAYVMAAEHSDARYQDRKLLADLAQDFSLYLSMVHDVRQEIDNDNFLDSKVREELDKAKKRFDKKIIS